MPSSKPPSGAPPGDRSTDAARRALAIRLDELATQVRGGSWAGVAPTWATVALDLEAHFAAETAEPPSPARPSMAQRSARQHQAERHAAAHALMAEISAQLDLAEPRACSLEVLAELVAQRNELEDTAKTRRDAA